MSREPSEETDPAVEELLNHLETLERTVDSPEERRVVRETRRAAHRLPAGRIFGRRIRRYTGRDMAEAFIGSTLIGLPLLVEDGVFNIAEFFSETVVGGVPVAFLANVVFTVGVVIALLYYTDIQRVEITDPLLGIVPRRLLGVLVISLGAAALLMGMWGRLEGIDPWLALCRISVVWAGMAVGASLGDILPG